MAEVMLVLGGVLLAALAVDLLGSRTRLPRVTLLLCVGLLAGPSGLDLMPPQAESWYPLVADLALVMVAFLLGGELTAETIRDHGRDVMVVSLLVVGCTGLAVGGGLVLAGFEPKLAIVLGAIATSTAPAAVADVVRESRASGPTTRTLLRVVAVDDAWGIIALSLALAWVLAGSDPESARSAVFAGGFDIVGALAVGAFVGVPMALLSGRLRDGEPTQTEAIAGVLLSGGLALLVGVSHLLAAMATGVVVANLAHHHRRPFRAIEGIEWPFMAVFFVLSGARLSLDHVGGGLPLIVAFIAARILGRWVGGAAASRLATPASGPLHGIGFGLLPQAGVAIGMALVVSGRVPEIGAVVLTTTMAATVFFELVGPFCTRRMLERAGEVPLAESP